MMTEFLWKILVLLKRNILGEKISNWIINSKICILYNDILFKKDVKKPTQKMLDSRKFFSENVLRVKQMRNLLADEKSKQIFDKEILFRQTHNRKDRPEYSRKDQYFPNDIIQMSENEVFVDCGAYNGDTIRQFMRINRNYKKIVAFEPDSINCKMIKKYCNSGKMVVVEAAVWNENTQLLFTRGLGSSSKVSNDGTYIKALKIDSIKECDDATFIKMDVEGSEYNALLGSYNTIMKNRPKLAICIYHSDEDMIRLFELINSWNLDYNYYVRQHAQKDAETVLYAIPK